MIICPDCIDDLINLGDPCFDLVVECLYLEEHDMYMAYDVTHYNWKLHRKGYVKPFDELELALRLAERNGYLISTEISHRLIGVRVNRLEAVEYDGMVCWCGSAL